MKANLAAWSKASEWGAARGQQINIDGAAVADVDVLREWFAGGPDETLAAGKG